MGAGLSLGKVCRDLQVPFLHLKSDVFSVPSGWEAHTKLISSPSVFLLTSQFGLVDGNLAFAGL